MTWRIGVLIAVAAGLAAGNVWYWSPNGAESYSSGRTRGMDNFQQTEGIRLQLPPELTANDKRVARNLFQPQLKKSKIKPKLKQNTAEATETPPPIQPEELSRRAARAQLGRIKYAGVVSSDSMKQAFLIRDKESLLVSEGDKFGDNIILSKITFDAVVLTDVATGASVEIILSGN